MSDIGVHSNVYQRVREYGDLVDEVLIGLKSGTSSPSDAPRRKLAGLLVGLESTSPLDLATAWLGMLLRGADAGERAGWAKVGRALLAPRIEPWVIERLEALARALEERRTEALARMHGVCT